MSLALVGTAIVHMHIIYIHMQHTRFTYAITFDNFLITLKYWVYHSVNM